MQELKEHKAYKMLDEKYPQVVLDYVILLFEEEYKGYETHKRAVVEAFRIFNTRVIVGNRYNPVITVVPEKMSASLSYALLVCFFRSTLWNTISYTRFCEV